MYNLREYVDFNRLDDKEYCDSKDVIVKKIHNYHLIKYKKNKLNRDNLETLGMFRSIIVNDSRVVSFSPPKSLTDEYFNDWMSLENDKYIAQPYIEGTMINLFWSSSIDDWEITTRSNIGANCHYNMDNNITFRTMFLEAMVFSGVEFESFNKDFMYSFVLQHPKNKRVVPVSKPWIYLVNIYELVEDYCVVPVTTDGGVEGDWNNFKNVKIPSYVPDMTSYKGFMKYMNDLINAQYSYVYPGYVIKSLDGVKRLKVVNPSYEYVKNIKGNTTKIQYRYYVLRQEGKVSEYLNYFPEFKNKFRKMRNDLHNFTSQLYAMYVSCYILKEKELKYFPKRFRTNMFTLHSQFIETRQKITFKKAVEYVNTMDTALLMYCMNMDYRKNEHTKEVLETLSFNKQPESTVPQ
tara:strand:- start:29 stop:1246 length:1218 start_codon:yes stop_codon:yes gene_type:complete